jgi:hypothetical protein
VVTNDGRNNVPVAPFEAGNVAVKSKILTMLMVATVANAMPEVVEQRTGFELHACLNWQMVHRLQLIEEHQAEFANVFRMPLIVLETPAKTAGGNEHLASFGTVAVRLLAGEHVTCNFLEQSFAEADARNGEQTDIEIASEGKEDEGGDGHDVGTVSADAVSFHALANIALEEIGKALAKQGEF